MGQSFENGINITGELTNQMIAPFLLLPFIENSIKQSSALNDNGWIIMDIGMEENSFFMKLANGIPPKVNSLAEDEQEALNNVQKRLRLLYPQHELKIYADQELLITLLKIQLNNINTTVKKETEKKVMEELYY